MITIEAVNSDIDKISADDKLTDVQKLIQIIKVVMKFVSTMRSNQLLTEEDKKNLKLRKNEEKKK
jgi:hypothetical protein